MKARWRVALVALAATPLTIAGLFLIFAWIGSAIPRNSDWIEPATGIEIMVGTNGVHTELVLPLTNAIKDWRTDFPAEDVEAAARPYTHIAVSWGERGVFLNTPTWADLSFTTALRAVTGGDGLLHVSHYVRPAPDEDFRTLRLTSAQYSALVRRIEAQVPPRNHRRRYPGYGAQDVFYDAPGLYHLGNTCNQWTSDTLAAAGVRTGVWTPLASGVMKWVPRPEN